jgi:hypothetical protein
MPTEKEIPNQFEFYLRELDNYLLVENTAHGVIIHASRDNCSERRKSFFLREISAEGYIPDRYQADPASQARQSVEWIVDDRWKKRFARTRLGSHVMVRLLVYGTVLWLGLITLVWVNASL